MEAALVIVWGAALLVIVGLLAAILLSGQPRPRPSIPSKGEPERQPPGAESLLCAFEEPNGRLAPDGRVWVRLPQAAWQPDWRTDLIRVEVGPLDRERIRLPKNWGNTRVLHACSLRAFRMTEMGQDIEIQQFAAPIEVGMGTDHRERGVLRCAMEVDGTWVLPPRADVTLPEADGPGGRQRWATMLVDQPGDMCLFRLPT